MQRTDWAERQVEDFLSLPLVREFVYRSPMAMIGNTEKEVADFLCILGSTAVLVSQKCQQDPEGRDKKQNARWVLKEAKKGVKQLMGALRTGHTRPMWCIHPRMGRVDFPNGLPKITHGIVLIETFQTGAVDSIDQTLPLERDGVPITYMSVNDFLNLVLLLRTLPELIEYLNHRKKLNDEVLKTIGNEKMVYETYQLTSGTFDGIKSFINIIDFVITKEKEIKALYKELKASFRYSGLIENVADQLATRDPNLPEELKQYFEPIGSRQGYLQLQTTLANTRLAERIIFGRILHQMKAAMELQEQGMTMSALFVDSIPEIVFVFGVWKKGDRRELPAKLTMLIKGAMAQYQRSIGYGIFDRDGDGYEVQMYNGSAPPTPEEIANGQKFFGSLKMASKPIGMLG